MIARTAVGAAWIIAALLVIAAVWLLIRPTGSSALVAPPTITYPLAVNRQGSRVAPPLKLKIPDAAVVEILSRSPFDPARRAFQRTPAVEVVPTPVLPPKLLGVLKEGSKRIALVEWRPSGETARLEVGSQTDQGVVARIGDSDMTLKSGEAEIVISLFD